jgi:hypothetical protein
LRLKSLLKRGALLTAANWQTVAIQFVAQVTFQGLLAVPVLGAAILGRVLLGADLVKLLDGSLRDIFRAIADTLTAEPIALVAFISAFCIVLAGGSVFLLLLKGGTIEVMAAANDAVGAIEREHVTLDTLRPAAVFTLERFLGGCARMFRRYLALGAVLAVVYAVSAAVYLGFVVVGYRAAGDSNSVVGWAFLAALSAVAVVLWTTAVNFFYLLIQIAMAVENVGLVDGCRGVGRFVRSSGRELGGVFLVVLGMVVGATLVSALAWSGVGLVAFVPLVGLAVFPLQFLALLIRGLVFEYIGLTAIGAYLTLYRRAEQPGRAPLAWAAARSRE